MDYPGHDLHGKTTTVLSTRREKPKKKATGDASAEKGHLFVKLVSRNEVVELEEKYVDHALCLANILLWVGLIWVPWGVQNDELPKESNHP